MDSAATNYADFHYSAPDGLGLHARIYGEDGHGTVPVICLPGLTRNARDFHDIASFLAARRSIGSVAVFDYRGRGGSAYDRNWKNYNVIVEADDIAAGAAALGIEGAAIIGTSRGGLITMVLAGRHPDLMRCVVFNDIGPVIEGDGLAQIRSNLSQTPAHSSFAEALAVQKAAHGVRFPALNDTDWERMVRAIYREDGDGLVPDYDPNLLKTLAGIDFSQPLPVMWNQFAALSRVPVMVIRGEQSRLLSQATVDEMARRHGRVEIVSVPGQGHPPMLETGDLPERIARFIERSKS